jgi:hypothetical protein
MGNVFVAGGDACGACQSLDGTTAAAPAHDNCSCSNEPGDDDCTHEYTGGGSNHYGPGDYDAKWGTELTVTCPDGSDISESFEVDLAGFDPAGGGDVLDFIENAIDAEADELCKQCPKDEPPNVV